MEVAVGNDKPGYIPAGVFDGQLAGECAARAWHQVGVNKLLGHHVVVGLGNKRGAGVMPGFDATVSGHSECNRLIARKALSLS